MFQVSRAVVHSRGMPRTRPIVASGGPWGGGAAPCNGFARDNAYRCPGHLPIAEYGHGKRVDDKLQKPRRSTPAPALLN